MRMNGTPHRTADPLEAEVLGAALRYVAFADWFESRPASSLRSLDETEAMLAFNRIEAELRETGGKLLRHLGHRQLVLERALQEATA